MMSAFLIRGFGISRLSLTTSDLPRYVFPGNFQTVFDDKSGYQHVRLHPDSEAYFGLLWEGCYFTFRVLPFGWKASAYLYHNLGLIVSSAARSLGVPVSQYIDDRHVGQLQANGDQSPSSQCAEAAAYIMCYLLIEAGYYIGLSKVIQFHLLQCGILVLYPILWPKRS